MFNSFSIKLKELDKKKGFTLLEIILTISFISILLLIAQPNLKGSTNEAKVIAVKADTELLSNSALRYAILNETWPTSNSEIGDIHVLLESLEDSANKDDFQLLDENKLKDYVGNSEIKIDEYVLATNGKYKGKVFHIDGKLDKSDNRVHWGESKLDNLANNIIPGDEIIAPDNNSGNNENNNDNNPEVDNGYIEVEKVEDNKW